MMPGWQSRYHCPLDPPVWRWSGGRPRLSRFGQYPARSPSSILVSSRSPSPTTSDRYGLRISQGAPDGTRPVRRVVAAPRAPRQRPARRSVPLPACPGAWSMGLRPTRHWRRLSGPPASGPRRRFRPWATRRGYRSCWRYGRHTNRSPRPTPSRSRSCVTERGCAIVVSSTFTSTSRPASSSTAATMDANCDALGTNSSGQYSRARVSRNRASGRPKRAGRATAAGQRRRRHSLSGRSVTLTPRWSETVGDPTTSPRRASHPRPTRA